MRRARMKAPLLWLLVPLMVASCKDEPLPPAPPPADTLTACVEQPTTLPGPPSGQLPCELLPPGFSR